MNETFAVKKRLVSIGTTNVISATCLVSQIVISCENAGTDWTLQIRDKGDPKFVLIPTFELAVPTDGNPNVVLNFKEPLPMTDGIEIVTAGATEGEAAVWLILIK